MERESILSTQYDSTSKMLGGFGGVPGYISNNLAMSLRPYQEEAITRFLFYLDRDQQNRVLPVQLLFNMATGSGKTLIMAALILELYKRGKRNFIFFVDKRTIINKTRANFLNANALKYLFAQRIEIEGNLVIIREVANFSEARDDAINIIFTTIQGLHSDLNSPREGQLTYDELKDEDVVLLSDEAHHTDALTKSKKELERENSWEQTVNNIMKLNSNNILLEFTATIDMKDANIWQKYHNRILYRYDLAAFRQDGYSKDVLVYSVDSNLMNRALQALIVSQFRKKVALDAGIYLKPVILFKAETKIKSKEFFNQFIDKITHLSGEDIRSQSKKPAGILLESFNFFLTHNISMDDLAAELRLEFAPERLLLIDSDNKAAEDQILLNTLEDHQNEVRAVFAVDMLNEGWDVLNLFDIVRLYDKRSGGHGKVDATTLAEAQLIGRGARYFPFTIAENDDKYRRKFDKNENTPLRAIEQLHYHSAHNPDYISDLRAALRDVGIIASNVVERDLYLKESFKHTHAYQKGIIWRNTRLTRAEALKQQKLLALDRYNLPASIQVTLPSGIGQEFAVFEQLEASDTVVGEQATKLLRFGDKVLTPNVIRAALNRNKKFTFSHLAEAFPLLADTESFMTGKPLLGGITIEVTGNAQDLRSMSQEQKLYIALQVLHVIEHAINTASEGYRGSDKFEPVPVKDIFTNVKRKFTLSEGGDAEVGRPQYRSPRYGLNLTERDWYAYSENYGTSEEKSLVKLFDGMMEDLYKKWSDIYLLRNEKAVTLYDFDQGRAFEPDYLLLANSREGNTSWQLFIEPKGGQLLEKDAWKQDFLEQIEARFDAMTLAESAQYKVIGLPFYTESSSATTIIDQLTKL